MQMMDQLFGDDGMTEPQTKVVLKSLGDLRGFVFDLDGTIWEGPTLLPGAAELVADLRDEGLGVVFASNCSRHGSPLCCAASSPTWGSPPRRRRFSLPSTWLARKSSVGWVRCRCW